MFTENQAIYIPIRALGDFIISAAVVKNHFVEKIPVLLPPYLTALFNATHSEDYFNVIGEANFGDQSAFFELYKIRDSKNLTRLINDLRTMHLITNKKNTYLLDYRSRRISFLNAKLRWPVFDQNIYQGKFNMFAEFYEPKQNAINNHISFEYTTRSKILVLPGSRLPMKRINTQLLKNIIDSFNHLQIDVAEFGNPLGHENEKVIHYSNFDHLINLINAYDLIISAESLPFHLAYYLNKPHFVIYNESKHFKQTFITPFMLQSKYFETFTGNNHNQIIERLKEILK